MKKIHFACQNQYLLRSNLPASLQQFSDAVTHKLFVHRDYISWVKIRSRNWGVMFTNYIDNRVIQRPNLLLPLKNSYTVNFHTYQVFF